MNKPSDINDVKHITIENRVNISKKITTQLNLTL